jgi:hypothetical protein
MLKKWEYLKNENAKLHVKYFTFYNTSEIII